MDKLRRVVSVLTVAGGLATGFAAPTRAAQTTEEFHKNKTLEFLVGYPPGGGYDLFGRGLVHYMAKHIPGTPNIVVQNMPGAGSLRMTQYLQKIAPKDGTVFAIMQSNLATTSVINPKGVGLDMNDFTYLGKLAYDPKVCFIRAAAGITSVADIEKSAKKTVWGATQRTDGTWPSLAVLDYLTKGKIKIVFGYDGSTDSILAMQRGEIDGFCTGFSVVQTKHPDWLKGKGVDILVQFGTKRESDIPNVPTVYDLGLTDQEKQTMDFLFLADTIARPIAAPPGIPADRTKALRDAFAATVRDPEFLNWVKQQKYEVDADDGATTAAIVKRITGTPASSIALAKKILR